MKRPFLALTFALILILSLPSPGQAADCQYLLGFKTLHDLIPGVVGGCTTNQRYNAFNGDSLQDTANGLLVWRKADNFTAFTDGYRTWVNGLYGVQQRLNTERFEWERDILSAAAGTSTPPPAVKDAPGMNGLYRVSLTRKGKNLYKDAGGAYFITRYCYEYVYGESAVYDADRSTILFRADRCDVAYVVAKYLESYINGTFKGWDGSTVFPLGNGQIWQQSGAGLHLSLSLNPEVIIYERSDAMWMRVEDEDEVVMVKRIR